MGNIKEYLTAAKCSYPVWGKEDTIYYLDTRDGVPQIWEKDLCTGNSRKMTHNSDKISRMRYFAGQVFFAMDMDGDENEQIYRIGADNREVMPVVYHPRNVRSHLGDVSGDWVYYASNKRLRCIFDICRKDLLNGKTDILIEGKDAVCLPLSISPDEEILLYSRRTSFADMQIYCKNLHTGEERKVSKEQQCAMEESPAWLGDGSGFYFISDREREFKRVLFWDRETGRTQEIYEVDWDVTHIAVSKDDKYLAVVVNEDGDSGIHILETASKKEIKIPQIPLGTIGDEEPVTWSETGYRLLFSFESGSRTQNIWLLDAEEGTLKQVTENENMTVGQDALVEPVLCRYQSFDGLEIPYWLYVPKGIPAENLPVAIYIHGGPESQIRRFYEETIQYLVSEGIAVAAPNVRGSTGYGKTYLNLDNKEKRLDAVRDIEALADHLTKTGTADAKRMAVFGRSYGGYMTLLCAARMPKLWACAVEVVGMFNLVSFLKHTAGYRRAAREAEYGSLEQDRQLLKDLSPEAVIEDLACPLLIVHGANDTRVPVSEAEHTAKRLEALGREVDYLCFEDEGHVIIKQKNRIKYITAASEFLKSHLLQK